MSDYEIQGLLSALIEANTVMLIAGFIVTIIQLILTGSLASKKDKSVIGWCIAALFFGMIPFVILAFKDDDTYIPRKAGEGPLVRTCPTCGKKIDTLKCPYCAQANQIQQRSQSNGDSLSGSVKVQVHNGTIHCPKCKLTQKGDADHCQGCGVKFDIS